MVLVSAPNQRKQENFGIQQMKNVLRTSSRPWFHIPDHRQQKGESKQH